MVISRIKLKNWKNFRNVDVELRERIFLFGPNGSGKSNLLDVFRFMRDIVKSGGGLQKALHDRGGLKKIRCLSARRHTGVEMEFHFSQSFEREENPEWVYCIGIEHEGKGSQRTLISKEEVWQDDIPILKRPDGSHKPTWSKLDITWNLETFTNISIRYATFILFRNWCATRRCFLMQVSQKKMISMVFIFWNRLRTPMIRPENHG